MSSTLYRKYRPHNFGGVIGQTHITQTLQNQLNSGRIGHAYLFCGSRGVGKTSLARIFSHAINCQNPQNAPCGSCPSCLGGNVQSNATAKAKEGDEKKEGALNLDIIEIDAASNNGVDDARDLRDKVKYPPVHGKYKVYIIDEVHMLTGSAFNALLKTLEEPPSHAVFILATTEPHKLPATILSRCMRFDFRLVGMIDLINLLADIFKKEGKGYQDEALRAIAAAAEGSVRDALSIADTCISASGTLCPTAGERDGQEGGRVDQSVLTAKDVAMILGGGGEQTHRLFNAIAAGDAAEALTQISSLYEGGKSMSVIAKEIASLSRDLMVAKLAPTTLKTTNERLEFLTKTAGNHSVGALASIMQMFAEMDSALRYSISPRIAMEAGIIRAIKLYALDLNALDERLLKIEKRLAQLQGLSPSNLQSAIPTNTQPSNPINISKIHKEQNDPSPPFSNANPAPDDYNPPNIPESFQADNQQNYERNYQSIQGNNQPQNVQRQEPSAARLWGKIITYFRRNSTPALTQVVGRQNPSKVALKGGTLYIAASRQDYLIMCDDTLTETLKAALESEGLSLKISVEKDLADIDMEKEVTALVDEFGRNKVNIIK